MATAFIQSWIKTTKQICRLSMKIHRYFREQRMEHLHNQEVSLDVYKRQVKDLSDREMTMIAKEQLSNLGMEPFMAKNV